MSHNCLAVWLALGTVIAGDTLADSNDLWDSTQGAVVTAHSGTIGAVESASDMFGTSSGIEGGNMLFRDHRPAGTVHWVEWQSPVAVEIGSFNLVAAHDDHRFIPAGQCDLPTFFRDAQHRGLDHFTLRAWDGIGFNIVLYDQDVALGDDNSVHPGENARLYDPDGSISVFSNLLDLTANVPVVFTNRWRAEFRQVGCPSNESGPRIIELDGFPPNPDSDADGVEDGDDLCPNTTIPESVPTSEMGLGVNRWALTDDDGDFETILPLTCLLVFFACSTAYCQSLPTSCLEMSVQPRAQASESFKEADIILRNGCGVTVNWRACM